MREAETGMSNGAVIAIMDLRKLRVQRLNLYLNSSQTTP